MERRPLREKAVERKGVKLGWIIALFFVAYLIWAIYTASQTQVVDSSNSSMPSNMPGMESPTETEIEATPMPSSMPGMNH